jgi:hypothetical protein
MPDNQWVIFTLRTRLRLGMYGPFLHEVGLYPQHPSLIFNVMSSGKCPERLANHKLPRLLESGATVETLSQITHVLSRVILFSVTAEWASSQSYSTSTVLRG